MRRIREDVGKEEGGHGRQRGRNCQDPSALRAAGRVEECCCCPRAPQQEGAVSRNDQDSPSAGAPWQEVGREPEWWSMGWGTGTEARAISGNCPSARLLATNIPVHRLLACQSPVPDVRGTGRNEKRRPHPATCLSRATGTGASQGASPGSLNRGPALPASSSCSPPPPLLPLPSPTPPPPGSAYLLAKVCADMKFSWQYTMLLFLWTCIN